MKYYYFSPITIENMKKVSSSIQTVIILAYGLAWLMVGCTQNNHQFDGTGSFVGDEVVVSSEASGRIITLEVEEGASLDKNQVVGLVDTTLLHLQKAQIIAQIRSTQKGLPNVRAQTAFFDDQIELARIKLTHLENEQERIKNLLNVESATPQQMDEVSAQVNQARQQIKVLENQKKAQISAISTQKEGLQARPMPLQAQLELLNEQIKRSRIVNPSTGTILAVYAHPGEYTAPGKPLYRIANLHDLRLKAYIPGHLYPNIHLNQEVTVLTDDGAGGYHSDTGNISWISEQAEFTPKTVQTASERQNLVYAIEVSVPNSDGRYKIGMYGEVKL